MESSQPTGRIRRGWQLTKSAWHVLRLDKELAALPLLSFLVSTIALVPFGLLFIITGAQVQDSQAGLSLSNWGQWAAIAGLYFVVTLIANLFGAAIVYGAVQRFRGSDPTIRSSLAGARHKFRPLAWFSLMMATVGLLFQILEDRLPFAGRIAVYLFDAAWSIANVFAVPIIVLSEENVMPLQATKRSVQMVKKVWGEGVVVSFGIGLIGALTYLLYAVVFVGLLLGLGSLQHGHAAGWAVLPMFLLVLFGILGIIVIGLVFSALGSIAKAALYYYATTGEAPASFDARLLRATMTPKKARRVFG